MTDRNIIDFVVACEDGMYLIMQIYDDREWDTFDTDTDPLNAIKTMLRAKINYGLLQESEIPS